MEISLTLDEAHRITKEVIAERGRTYVYDSEMGCYYFNEDGAPDCMVGAIFAKKDVPAFNSPAEWANWDDDVNGSGVDVLAKITDINDADSSDTNMFKVICDLRTMRFLTSLQTEQDTGYSWQRSLLLAEARVGLITLEDFARKYDLAIREQFEDNLTPAERRDQDVEGDVQREMITALERLKNHAEEDGSDPQEAINETFEVLVKSLTLDNALYANSVVVEQDEVLV